MWLLVTNSQVTHYSTSIWQVTDKCCDAQGKWNNGSYRDPILFLGTITDLKCLTLVNGLLMRKPSAIKLPSSAETM